MKAIKLLIFNQDVVLDKMIQAFSDSVDVEIIRENYMNHLTFNQEKLVLCFTVDSIGSNEKLLTFIRQLKNRKITFNQCYAGVLVNSGNALYTKTLTQQCVYLMNEMGLGFIGQPMVEVIQNYENFISWQKLYTEMSLEEICHQQVKKMAKRLDGFNSLIIDKPKILVLHASSYETSNTLMLWKMIEKHLEDYNIQEIEIEDGKIIDCSGCPFETCQHFASQKSCYYGGVIVDDVLPAIESCDYIVWICPNYNDSLSAKLMAVINRMTVLYRRISLKNKVMFSVIISGNSGSDSVAKHLISALNLNKGFILPPTFSIQSIANDSGKIAQVSGIEDKAFAYAKKIKEFQVRL